MPAPPARCCFFTLKIDEAAEQECFDLWLFGSADGANWGPKPLATPPQHFHPGEYPTLVELSAEKETKYLRAHWEVSRWGRGELKPCFVCGLTLRDGPGAGVARKRNLFVNPVLSLAVCSGKHSCHRGKRQGIRLLHHECFCLRRAARAEPACSPLGSAVR